MSKSMSVTFDDGTTHTYDDVPDEVTQEQVAARASQDFPDRTVSDLGEGAAPNAAPAPTPTPAPTMGQQALGAAQTGAEMVMQHPAVPATAAGLYKANKIANTWMASKNAEMEAAKQIAAQRAASMAGHQNIQQQKINLKAGLPPNSAAPGEQAFGQMAQGLTNPPAQAPVAPTTAPAPQAAPQEVGTADNFLTRMSSIAKQYAPSMEGVQNFAGKVASSPIVNNPVTRTIGRVASSPYTMGAQMALTPSSTGPAVPESGPLRGSEINPHTNRPWTMAELEMYKRHYGK